MLAIRFVYIFFQAKYKYFDLNMQKMRRNGLREWPQLLISCFDFCAKWCHKHEHKHSHTHIHTHDIYGLTHMCAVCHDISSKLTVEGGWRGERVEWVLRRNSRHSKTQKPNQSTDFHNELLVGSWWRAGGAKGRAEGEMMASGCFCGVCGSCGLRVALKNLIALQQKKKNRKLFQTNIKVCNTI